MLENDD